MEWRYFPISAIPPDELEAGIESGDIEEWRTSSKGVKWVRARISPAYPFIKGLPRNPEPEYFEFDGTDTELESHDS